MEVELRNPPRQLTVRGAGEWLTSKVRAYERIVKRYSVANVMSAEEQKRSFMAACPQYVEDQLLGLGVWRRLTLRELQEEGVRC